MPTVPKTRNKSKDKATNKRGTTSPPRGKQTSAADARGVVSNPRTSKQVKTAPRKRSTAKKEFKSVSLGVLQSDSLGYKLASLPMANKDKEMVAKLLHEELGISDLDRFMREVHRTDIPTPKT